MNDGEVRELAREILAREEYARWREEPGAVYDFLLALSDALTRAWSWLESWLPQWLIDLYSSEWSTGPEVELGPLGRILGPLFALAVVALFVVLLRSWVAQKPLNRERVDADREAAGEDLRRRAEALAGDGHFLEAAHAVQLAALQLLLEARWLELDRFEPNRTLRERLSRSRLPEALRQDFTRLLDALEARWFGDRGEGRGLFEEWCALHERLGALGRAG